MRLRQLFEEPRTAVMAFGRMNPPTIGHQKLVDKIKSIPGDHYVFLSQSQKPKTDPLAFEDKLRYAKFFFPAVNIGHPDVKTIIQALSKISELGYDNLIYVAGSDRVQSFDELINKYNGQPDKNGDIAYNFKSIKVISAGERDPDADGAEGMSASKMRAAAAADDLDSFKQGVPRQEVADEMFAAVRSGMGIKDTATVGESLIFEAATKADADAMIAAIKAFQTAAGLKADGIVGPNTRAKAAELMKNPQTATTVTTLQTAIKDFQTKAGIAVDGKVGPETMGAVKQAQSAPAAAPAAPEGGATDAEKDAGAGQAQTAPAQPQTSDQATQQAGQAQTPDANAQKAQPEDPNSTTPVPTDNKAAPQTDAELDADSKDNATPEPAAQPKVSKEVYMQMAPDRDAGMTNFNVQKMKAKYPEPYLDIPNDDGTVTRAYGPEANLQNFIQTDKRGKGLKLGGSTAAPAQEPAQEPAKTTPTDGAEQPGKVAQQAGDETDAEKQTSRDIATGKDKAAGQDDADAQDNAQDNTQDDADAQDNAQQDQTPPNDDPDGFDAASDVTDDDLNSPDEPGDKPAPKPGKETYTVNGKEMSRNDVAKRLNALLRKARGTAEGIDFNSPLARLLTEALSDAEKKELQALIDAVRDSRYFATFINRPKTLKALQDAGIQNIPGKPAKRERPSRGGDTVSKRKSVRKYYKTDPETGKEVEIDKDEADAMQAKFDKATNTKRDADGKDDFDRKLDGDGSFDRALDGDGKDGTTTTSTSSSSKDGNTTRTSSSTSTVTRTGNTSTSTKTSGGGSTTRFSKVMRATDETKKLRARKKELRNQMRDFADQYKKDNPDAGTFDHLDAPEYKKMEDEYESFRGMDGKIAKSKEMVHPGGQIDKDGNIRYNTKDGKWDGEQYDPKRKNDLRDNIDFDRIKVLAGV